jgi:four helix bundle protein
LGTIKSYQDLVVWQKAMDLAVATYEATRTFPQSELYGLTSQMRRSAASVAANIAEGYGRDSTGSYIQFLKIACGSLKEHETHVILAQTVGLFTSDQSHLLLNATQGLGINLNSLIKSIQGSGTSNSIEG